MKPLDPAGVPSRPKFDVHLGPIAAGPYHPCFDVNPNMGEPMGRDRRRVVADNTVFHESGHPSRIVLPIISPSHP
jgi:hypothetical protein